MDEDLAIINNNTRNEKIKNFFIKHRNLLFSIITLIVITIMIFFGYGEYTKSKKENISNLYNLTLIDYSESNKKNTIDSLIDQGFLRHKKDKDIFPSEFNIIKEKSYGISKIIFGK